MSENTVLGFLGVSPAEAPDLYAAVSPLALLPLDVPTVLVHGDGDLEVDVKFSRDFVDTAISAGGDARLLELRSCSLAPLMDHFAVITPQHACWKLIADAAHSLLPQLT
eukprot:gnl/TRDRNA2_/TRDRNA2_155096_c0_seq2.p1 gnl/TRDRNA2_/TRDRNA2_155096_c0~~gnl/TRDRNA2_/TRDRNA2_155096_c0_seq2.p1  ORF type:complete len:109 (+),score=28.65 gnl/TRDRNA2_/TRDRNA2_155096_c0_seq2:94-420(+)